MANYNSQYTGAEVDAAVGKANAIPSATDINDTVTRALKTPLQALQNNELVGVGIDGSQIRVQLGEGLTLEGSISPYTLKASGGGAKLYKHTIYINGDSGSVSSQNHHYVVYVSIINNSNESINNFNKFNTALNNKGFINAYGRITDNSNSNVFMIPYSAVYTALTSFNIGFYKFVSGAYTESNSSTVFDTSSVTFTDTIVELS